MGKTDTILIAVGGGEIEEAEDILKEFLDPLKKHSDPRIVIMTVATSKPVEAGKKYRNLFKKRGIKNIDVVDISLREDAFAEAGIEKIRKADALFFTGGDQLNVTSLLGGSPIHKLINDRIESGFLVAGTSAGATMMSNGMITSGRGDRPPKVGAVKIAPGMDLLPETMIDTHFSQRGRHGRLLTAIAHYPQDLGIGIDEKTAIVVKGKKFKVFGEGAVTVMDGSKMRHNDLPYRKDDRPIGMFGVDVHVLPAGYTFDLVTREPISPALKKMAGNNDED
ncbi:MAG: cyanophycinase [Pyrinomonadaceae bacterium]